jgi:membrane protein
MKTPRALPSMLKEAFTDWKDDQAPRLGAALAYYTVLSLAPLLVVAVAIAGFAFGREAAQGQIVAQIGHLVGGDTARMIEETLKNANKPGQGIVATVLGMVTLLLGASGVFNELRAAMNLIWEVPPKKSGGLLSLVRERLLSFAMVLVIGFLLLVSLVVSAGLSAMEGMMGGATADKLHVAQALNTVVALGVITTLFAVIFKYLPDAEPMVAWKDVWIGAFMTAVLFTIGKFGIGLYLGRGTVGSAYGAAGSLVVLLVWVYYAAQIFFFGAELTQVYARRFGSRVGVPAPAAAEAEGEAKVPQPGKRDEAREGREVPPREPSRSPTPRPAWSARPVLAPPEGGLAVAKGAAIAAALLALGFTRRR